MLQWRNTSFDTNTVIRISQLIHYHHLFVIIIVITISSHFQTFPDICRHNISSHLAQRTHGNRKPIWVPPQSYRNISPGPSFPAPDWNTGQILEVEKFNLFVRVLLDLDLLAVDQMRSNFSWNRNRNRPWCRSEKSRTW